MGRHHPDADSHANADSDTKRDSDAEPRRQPGSFAIAERLTWRVTRTDVCVRAAVPWRIAITGRKRITWRSFAIAFANSKVIALAIARRDAFSHGVAGEKRLSVTCESRRRVDTEIPE